MYNNLTFNSINKYFVIYGLVALQGISCSRSSRLSMGNWRDVLCCAPKKAKGLKPGESPAGHAPNEPLTAGAVLEPLVKSPAGHTPSELLMDIFRCVPRTDLSNTKEVSRRYCVLGEEELQERFTQENPYKIDVVFDLRRYKEIWRKWNTAHVVILEQEFLKKETWENFRKSPIRDFNLWVDGGIQYHEFSSIVDHFGEKFICLDVAEIGVANEKDFINAKYLEDIAKLTKIKYLSITVRRGRSDKAFFHNPSETQECKLSASNKRIRISYCLMDLKGSIAIDGQCDAYTVDKILETFAQLKNFNNLTNVDLWIYCIRRISYQELCSLLDKFPHIRFLIHGMHHWFSQEQLQQLRNSYPSLQEFS